MGVFDRVAGEDYEQVVFNHDRSSGLRAIIAIHSTVLGPALGGTRFWRFESEEAALTDAIITLANTLGLSPVAEGIERSEQQRKLLELQCELGQGFLFAKPLPPEELVRYMDEYVKNRQPEQISQN